MSKQFGNLYFTYIPNFITCTRHMGVQSKKTEKTRFLWYFNHLNEISSKYKGLLTQKTIRGYTGSPIFKRRNFTQL